jgi:uncharacterized membrane protein
MNWTHIFLVLSVAAFASNFVLQKVGVDSDMTWENLAAGAVLMAVFVVVQRTIGK